MSKQHMPGADRTTQYWAGWFTGSKMDTNCGCLHTTETGNAWPGYSGGAVAPHMTIRPSIKARTVTIRQHFPADRSSRALVNLSGGVETNTLNVFQIELIGTCDSKYRKSRKEWGVAGVDYIYWPDAPDWLLAAIAPVFGWLDAEWPNFKIVDATPRGWLPYPSSYGNKNGQRMSFSEWRNAYGIFGHQHVPENTHGDPGNFPIKRLIELATGASTPIDNPEIPPATPGERAHTVVKGDTLAALAREYDTTVAALATLNGLANPNRLAIGQKLRVPPAATTVPPAATEHVVVKGDTLSAIAKTYGTTVANLTAWNALPDPNRIEPGQVIRLTKPTTPAPDPEPSKPVHQDVSVLILNAASRNADVIKAKGAWSERGVDLARYILDSGEDIVGVVELYEDQRPVVDELLLPTYRLLGVKGGRVLYGRAGVTAVIGGSRWADLLPGKGTKYSVGRKLRLLKTGARLNVSVGHLSYETSSAGVKKRAKEAPAWIGWMRRMFPTDYDLYIGDVNSPAGATTRRDDVGPIFAAYNLRDLRHDVKVAVGKGRYHLLRAFAGLVKARSITTEPVDFSDHSAVHLVVRVPTA